MEALCELFGNSRQAYYQYKRLHAEEEVTDNNLCEAVKGIREEDERIGALKLYRMLRDIFQNEGMMGRDSFFNLLRRKKLMLKPVKGIATTNSNHRFRKYKNLIKEFIPTGSNQLWVSDITYIRIEEEVCYLHLITDAYSHMIVGWCLSKGLHAIHTLEALNQAILQAPAGSLAGLIHHSDRGCQYCSDLYVKTLKTNQISISMTEDSKPTDNAIAERVNGIIKQGCGSRLKQAEGIIQARQIIGQYIEFYNTRRPHMSIEMLTPEVAHHRSGEMKKYWKKKNYPPKGAIRYENGYLWSTTKEE